MRTGKLVPFLNREHCGKSRTGSGLYRMNMSSKGRGYQGKASPVEGKGQASCTDWKKCNVCPENSETSSWMKCRVGVIREVIAEISRKGVGTNVEIKSFMSD